MATTQLQIPAPCPENWAAMPLVGAGRHCTACQKTVVDFTQKTDAEILTYLAHAARSQTCGRFRGSQLARPLQPPATTSRWRAWLSALLAAGSLGQLAAPRAAAQAAMRGTAGPVPAAVSPAQAVPSATPTGRPTASSNAAGQPAATRLSPGSRTISGTVRDEATHDPLPGVTVLVKGTTFGVSTSTDGTFTLTIPGDAPTAQLGFHYIGYNSVEQNITFANNIPLVVALNTDGVMLSGEVVIIPAKQPWPWHPRRLYYWSKGWLTRPFRR